MTKITDYIEAPLNGISQAAHQVRRKDTAEDTLNALVEVPEGFRKRPPLEFIGTIMASGLTPANTLQGVLIEGPSEGTADDVYLILNRNPDDSVTALLRSYDTLGAISLTVTPAAQSYLDSSAPAPVRDTRLLTVEDYTFIANRKVPIAAHPDSIATRPFEAIVWVKLSDYSRKYVLTIDGITVTYVAPEGNASDDADDIDTSQIMDRMLNGGTVTPNGSVTPSGGIGSALTSAGFTWSRSGSLLFLSRATDYAITVEDGIGGTAMVALKGSTPRPSDLPVYAPDGFTIRITGAAGSNNDDYWIAFEADPPGSVTGVYREVPEPGANKGVDPASLPIGLVFDQDTSTWTLDTLPWLERQTGNADIAPSPLTFGDFIQSVGWFRGRLRLLTSGEVLYTGADSPFRLFPSTLLTATDSDPIQLINPSARRSFFREGATFDQRDVLMGTASQAVVSCEGPFRLAAARIDELASYPYRGGTPLLPAGDNIHFLSKKGAFYGGLYELSINGPLQRTQAEDLTAGLPRRLPLDMDRGASLKDSYLSLYAKTGEASLYAHVYRYAGQDRIQSGFFPFQVPTGYQVVNILAPQSESATVMDVWLLDPAGNVVVTRMDFSPMLRDSATSQVLTTLDLRVTEADCDVAYDEDNDRTGIQLPYVTTENGPVQVSRRGDPENEGLLAEIQAVTDTGYVIVNGDWSATEFYAGLVYDAYWTLSRIHHRDPQSQKPLYDGGAFGLRHLVFDCGPSSFLSFEVTASKRPTVTYELPPSAFSEVPLFEGPFAVPMGDTTDKLTIRVRNASHLQGTVLGFTFVGEHNLRSMGV